MIIDSSKRYKLSSIFAWGLIGILISISLVLPLVHAGAILNVLFTPAVFLVGTVFYYFYKKYYVALVMWTWLFTPLVRRIADWQSSFHHLSPIMIAPLMVTMISGLSLPLAFQRIRSGTFSLYFALLGVLVWGAYVGFLQSSPAAVIYDFASWSSPVLFSIYILVEGKSAAQTLSTIFSVMTWGTLILGAYAIWQFFYPPIWDQLWMLATQPELGSTIGQAVSTKVRVFSTLNSYVPFACFMVAGLLVQFGVRNQIKWLAGAIGFAALLLSLVRSAWGGLIIGLALLFCFIPARKKLRILMLTGVLVALAIPILANGPIAEVIEARLQTLSNLEYDTSLFDRETFYSDFVTKAFGTIGGTGLGMIGQASRLTTETGNLGTYGDFDSGILHIFFALGFMAPVLLGLLLTLILRVVWSSRHDMRAVVCAAIACGMVAQLPFLNTLVGVTGMFVFPFLALAQVIGEANKFRAPDRYAPVMRVTSMIAKYTVVKNKTLADLARRRN